MEYKENFKHSKIYKDINDTLVYPPEKIHQILVNSPTLLRQNSPYKWDSNKVNMFASMIIITYLTGGRISEILKLRFQDIKVEDKEKNKKANWVKFLLVTKKTRTQNAKRYLSINYDDLFYKKMLDIFFDWFLEEKPKNKDEDYMFKVSRSHAYRIFSLLGFNPHFLRKLKLTTLANTYNFNVPKLQKFSGHKEMKSLAPYIQFSTKDIEEDLLKVNLGKDLGLEK